MSINLEKEKLLVGDWDVEKKGEKGSWFGKEQKEFSFHKSKEIIGKQIFSGSFWKLAL